MEIREGDKYLVTTWEEATAAHNNASESFFMEFGGTLVTVVGVGDNSINIRLRDGEVVTISDKRWEWALKPLPPKQELDLILEELRDE